MKLLLEAIKFNHDSTSATNDAINIRRNETLFVNVPEWCSGVSANPEDSPAAYALCETRGNPLTIQAKFRCTDPNVAAIEVRAVDARINLPFSESTLFGFVVWLSRPLLRRIVKNVLGEIREKYIFPCEGETEFESFELKNVRIWEEGVGVNDIAWRWQYRLSRNSPWVDFEVSQHRIYTILRVPRCPWQQEPYEAANTQLPWAEVLDYACTWAASARLVDDAASGITESVYNLGEHGIVRYSGSGGYTREGPFDCTAFLERLRGGRGKGGYVNCDDCSTIVSSFANILGCDLWQSRMTGFLYNPIKKIGQSVWFNKPRFNYHEVAWEAECDRENDVYDACLQIDGDNDPSKSPHDPLLVANLRFGNQGDGQYHHRLVVSSNPNGGQPEPDKRLRRAIGKKPSVPVDKFVDKDLLAHLGELFEFENWKELNLLETNLFVLDSIVHEDFLPGWVIHRIEVVEATAWPRVIKSVWQLAGVQRDVFLSLELFECQSLLDARKILLRLLTEIQTADMARREDFGGVGRTIGDVFFSSPDETRIIFARANLVLLLRNLESDVMSLLEVARQLDQIIISEPKPEDGQVTGDMQRFQFAGDEPFSFEPLPLRVCVPDLLKGTPLTYKFFSSTGEIFWQDELIYKPAETGQQRIVIFAINAHGHAFKQVLEFEMQ